MSGAFSSKPFRVGESPVLSPQVSKESSVVRTMEYVVLVLHIAMLNRHGLHFASTVRVTRHTDVLRLVAVMIVQVRRNNVLEIRMGLIQLVMKNVNLVDKGKLTTRAM